MAGLYYSLEPTTLLMSSINNLPGIVLKNTKNSFVIIISNELKYTFIVVTDTESQFPIAVYNILDHSWSAILAMGILSQVPLYLAPYARVQRKNFHAFKLQYTYFPCTWKNLNFPTHQWQTASLLRKAYSQCLQVQYPLLRGYFPRWGIALQVLSVYWVLLKDQILLLESQNLQGKE